MERLYPHIFNEEAISAIEAPISLDGLKKTLASF